MSHNVFSKGQIGSLVLRNRIIKAACFEGMSQGGGITPDLIKHHRSMAAGGVGMSTVAYCSIRQDGRAYEHEMWMRKSLVPGLKQLTDQVHREGAAVSIQLGHCGYFASKRVIGKRPFGASWKFNLFRLTYCRSMTDSDIEEVVDEFGMAATLALQAGFDAIEIHAGHGYLLSQFLSPYTNKRTDGFGGDLDRRMRFPAAVIRRVREVTRPDFPLLVKMNVRDGMQGGLELEDAIEVAKMCESAGASALIPSSGFTSKTPFLMLRGPLPIKEMVTNQTRIIYKFGLQAFGKIMVKEYPFRRVFHFEAARNILNAVRIPVVYIGGVGNGDDINRIMDAGFEFIQMGRALIRDPAFVNHLAAQTPEEPACDHCNRCVAAMDGGGVYCVSKERGFI